MVHGARDDIRQETSNGHHQHNYSDKRLKVLIHMFSLNHPSSFAKCKKLEIAFCQKNSF